MAAEPRGTAPRVELERALAEQERVAAEWLYRVDSDALTDLRSKAAFVVDLESGDCLSHYWMPVSRRPRTPRGRG